MSSWEINRMMAAKVQPTTPKRFPNETHRCDGCGKWKSVAAVYPDAHGNPGHGTALCVDCLSRTVLYPPPAKMVAPLGSLK